MAQDLDIEFKYSHLKDPETCPIEELKLQVEELETQVGFFDTKQLAIKKFINSVYGALGSKYFVAHNVHMAQSITSQGQDLNHYSENSVNAYFKGIFQSDPTITLYYQWVHHAADGTKYTYGTPDKPADYYSSGKWTECESWEPAVKNGKKLTKDDLGCLKDNSRGKCDWFQTRTKLSKKLGVDPERMKTFDISKGKTTETGELTGEVFDYLDGNQSLTIGGDTDSCSGGTLVEHRGGVRQKIEDLFRACKYESADSVMVTENGTELVPGCGYEIAAADPETGEPVWGAVRYVMRHRVSKARYRLTTESGRTVEVTGDHSVMVERGGRIVSVKAAEIDPASDRLVSLAEDGGCPEFEQ